ncbi:MAG: ABC transporter permease [Candidatus Neomarinimicrobiota bacterium]
MLKNYLKIAIRNLLKQKGYSFINIAGLAVGMACCILIMAYIADELSFDRFHNRVENIYRVATVGKIAGRTINIATVPAPMGPAMVDEFPEVSAAVRFRTTGDQIFSYQDKKFFESNLMYADNSLFEVFSFRLLSGDPATALAAPHTMVITPELARKYFGDDDPVGKILRMNNEEDFTITGLIAKPPGNSHIQFDLLLSFETFYKRNPDRMVWYNWNYQTYILLADDADYQSLEQKLVQFNERHIGEFVKAIGGDISNYLQPLASIHLHSQIEAEVSPNGDIRYVYAFALIAGFILLIACINFMNLATARSANRAREVGLRKVVGADRRMLISQFLSESLVLALISFLLALLIVVLAHPYFNHLAGRTIALNLFSNPWIVAGLIGLILFIGLAAGSYPALFLSRFRPAVVLKGTLQKGAKSSRFRSILVIFQFAISIALIIGTGIIFNQLDYMQTKDMGFNKEQLLVIAIRDDQTTGKADLIKTELKKIDGVVSICGASKVPGEESFNTSVFYPEGYAQDQSVLMENFTIDESYLETYQIELLAGRNFSREFTTDPEQSIMINETAARTFGWDDPVGKLIYLPADDNDMSQRQTVTVIGLTRDIHHRSVQHAVEPLLIDFNPGQAFRITVRLKTDNITNTMEQIEQKWLAINPDHPFDYFFLDEYFDSLYRGEERLGNIFRTFTVFAVLIGCLGLFGLASFAAEQRTKEIGIRKVLGSSVSAVVLLLYREFITLIIIANLVAWPVIYFTMRHWLKDFPYQTSIGVGGFILAALLALGIALLTVSYQSLKAALANPVQSLRYE